MKRFALFIFLFCSFSSLACLNISGHNLEGKYRDLEVFAFLEERKTYPDRETIEEQLQSIKMEIKEGDTSYFGQFDDLHTDYAGYLILYGKYQNGIDYLHQYVSDKDSNYSYASNLGVAHELLGNLDSALYWTKRGLEIDPNSHSGSEWIHVRILEIKLAMQENPNWFENHTLFDFPISTTEELTSIDSIENIEDFYFDLFYQLEERSYFVEPEGNNPIMGKSLFLLADIVLQEYDVELSLPPFILAQDYDSTLESSVQQRIYLIDSTLSTRVSKDPETYFNKEVTEYNRKLQREKRVINRWYTLIGLFFSFGLLSMLIMGYRR